MSVRMIDTDVDYTPGLFCDACGGQITDGRDALAASAAPFSGKGSTAPVAYLHKGDCDDRWRERLTLEADMAWHELDDHFERLMRTLEFAP